MFNINIILLNKNKRNCKLCKVSNFSRGFKVEATKLASDKPSEPKYSMTKILVATSQ